MISPNILRVQGLQKTYGELSVLKGIDLSVQAGEVVAVIGPSGSGKSTLIRCINRLEEPSAGSVHFQDREVIAGFRSKHPGQIGTRELRRHVGMVFQQFNLYPHKTVLQNITMGPCLVLKEPAGAAQERALALLAAVGLSDKRDVYPNHLSGGQKQRVGIARALAMQPQVLLLDEVTSALDPELVGEVLQVIRNLAQQGMTMILVTHEMAFAADVANRIVFMENGKIVETGVPDKVLKNPQTDRLRAFLGRHLYQNSGGDVP